MGLPVLVLGTARIGPLAFDCVLNGAVERLSTRGIGDARAGVKGDEKATHLRYIWLSRRM